jgi:hypothetical protein
VKHAGGPLAFSPVIAAVLAVCAPGQAQAQAQVPKNWTAPKTADGHPDLSGYWTNVTITPLERPAQFAGKAFLTPAEAAAYEHETVDRNNVDKRANVGTDADLAGAYNNFWWDRGTKVVPTLRTSLIVDPADGRIPALTPEAQKRQAEVRTAARGHATDGPENRPLAERCLLWPTAGPPMMPSFYNNNYQIVQSGGTVMVLVEMIHDARIIPTDGSPHLPSRVKLWLGDPRGRWEGSTLVVESTNFSEKANFHGSDTNLRLTEKFTRTGPDSLLYQFTVDDPTAFTKPWSGEIPMTRTEGPIIEYACHEGNYAMAGVLAGARNEEKTQGGK